MPQQFRGERKAVKASAGLTVQKGSRLRRLLAGGSTVGLTEAICRKFSSQSA